jgi:hypothetical protein
MLFRGTAHKKQLIAWKKITVVTTVISYQLAANGFKISSREILNSGSQRDTSKHKTEKIIAMMLHSTHCMTNVKLAWLNQKMLQITNILFTKMQMAT